jgi:HK97 family phage prohead protease
MSDDLLAAEALETLRGLESRIEYKADIAPAVLDISDREVTALFSVDNLDSLGDITEVSAFKRSIDHRSQSIPHLYMHNLDAPAIARVLSFQALKRSELPTDVQTMYPEATGGMACVSRYLKSGRGAEVLEGIKEGIAYQMSFGYKALDSKARTLPDGRKVRVIKELRLYEVSTTPPGHAANDATRVRLGKALAALEELKAGWRHGKHDDVALLNQIAALVLSLGANNISLIEPAPQPMVARTSQASVLIDEITTLLGGVHEISVHEPAGKPDAAAGRTA